MQALRSSVVVRATRTIHLPTPPRRFFSTTTHRAGVEPKYDPPTGWLWGIKPGTKPPREGWELTFYWLYCAPIALTGVFMFFKPDTTIQTWALEEARRRLEKEGIIDDPFPNHVEAEDDSSSNKA